MAKKEVAVISEGVPMLADILNAPEVVDMRSVSSQLEYPFPTTNVGVVVFGNDQEAKQLVADTIHRSLVGIGMPFVERHEFHAPGQSHQVDAPEPVSILEAISARAPKLFSARVLIATDNIGQSLISHEDAGRMKRFGNDSLFDGQQYHARRKLRELVEDTEDKIADAIGQITVKAIEATSSFTDEETQGEIVSDLLAAVADGNSAAIGLDHGSDYAIGKLGADYGRPEKLLSFKEMTQVKPRSTRADEGRAHTEHLRSPNKVAEVARNINHYVERARKALEADLHPNVIHLQFISNMKDMDSLEDEAAVSAILMAAIERAEAELASDYKVEQFASKIEQAFNGNTRRNQKGYISFDQINSHLRDAAVEPDPELCSITLPRVGASNAVKESYVTLQEIDNIVQSNESVEDTLEDLYDLAQKLPEGVSMRSSGASISKDDSGPEVSINIEGAKYTRF